MWSIRELENVHQDELYSIIDEIPSGSESEESDTENVLEEKDANANNLPEGDLFDIEKMNILFKDEVGVQIESDNGNVGRCCIP